MKPEHFDHLLLLVKEDITKKTIMRHSISPETKLVITIQYLATDSTYDDLACRYRVRKTTIGRFIPEVCDAVYENLKEEYLKVRIKYF